LAWFYFFAQCLSLARQTGKIAARIDCHPHQEPDMPRAPLLHYTEQGSGPPLLVLHGLFGAGNNWSQIGKALAADYRVIQVDLRNHGQSFHDDLMDYPAMASDVWALMDHLQLEKSHILGHSMGGKVAMECALQHPDRVDKLIVVDIAPVAYDSRHHAVFDGIRSVELAHLQQRKDAETQLSRHIQDPIVVQFLMKGLHRTPAGFQWRFNAAILELHYANLIAAPAATGQFNGPTLFIKGMLSDYILPDHKAAIAQRFPNAQAKLIAGAGHWPHAEKPRLLLLMVNQFLQDAVPHD